MIRFLDREAEITTRYGGGFVQSIDGRRGRARRRPLQRLVLLRQRDRVAGRRGRGRGPRRRPDLVGLPRLDRRDAGRRRWSAPGRSRSRRRRPPSERAAGRGRVPRRRRALRRGRRARSAAPGRAVVEPAERTSRGAAAAGRALGPGARATRSPRCSSDGPATSGVFARFERVRRRLAGCVGARRGRPSRPRAARRGPGRRAARRRGPADLGRHRHRRGRGRGGGRELLDAESLARPLRGRRPTGDRDRAARERGGAMRSPLAYAPRPGPLPRAERARGERLPGLVRVRRLRLLEPDRARRRRRGRGRRRAARRRRGRRCAPRRAGRLTLGVLIVAVNAIASQRGDTILRPRLATCRCSARSTSAPRRWSRARCWRCGSRSCSAPSRSTRPASIPTGCCACCARSPATRR